jgi:FixJ family two-component response regulator
MNQRTQDSPTTDNLIGIIEPDTRIRSRLSKLLESKNFQVLEFDHATDFIDKAATSPITCLISEFNLPDMTGLELIKQLKRKNISAPVIFVASNCDVFSAVKAIRMGALDFFEKPFVNRYLVDRVIELTRSKSH